MSAELSKSHLPWPVRVGRRVAIRRRLSADDPSGAAFTDVTGQLLRADGATAAVQSRHGVVEMPWSVVVAAKEIPARADRPGRPHRVISIDDLQRLMVDGMPGLLQLPLGDWLLRTAQGYTGRGNSVLVVGDPGRSTPEAVQHVAEAYADLGRPALFQIPGETGFVAAENPVAAEVLSRGGTLLPRVLVMTAAVAEVALARATADTAVRVCPTPDDGWWAAISERTREHREIAQRVFAEVADGQYLTAIGRNSDPLAAARSAYSPGWVGLYDLHTLPEHRARGYGRTLTGEAARDAQLRGVRSIYLQVSGDNTTAIALYESLGFRVHHEYVYARL